MQWSIALKTNLVAYAKRLAAIKNSNPWRQAATSWNNFGDLLFAWGESRWRLFFLVVLLLISLSCIQLFNQERELVYAISWWVASVLICSLGIALTIPVKLKCLLEGAIPFFNIWLSVAFAIVIWLASSLAANELNAVFKVPASLLPKAVIALTFLAVLAIVGLILGGVAIFFQVLMLLTALTAAKKKLFRWLVPISFFAASFITAYLGFLIAINPVTSGTAKTFATLIALEFDFEDNVLCRNFLSNNKYLFLDANKNYVLSVVTAAITSTPKEISEAKKSGKEAILFSDSVVRRCVYE